MTLTSCDQRRQVPPDDVPTPPANYYSYFVANGTIANLSPGTPTPAAGTECKMDSSRNIIEYLVVAGVTSFNSRTGPVTPIQADYDAFFLTPAEGAAAYDALGAAAAAQAASQPLDSDLTAIAALTTTAFGRSFLTLADAAAARTQVGSPPTTLTLTATSPITGGGDLSANRSFGIQAATTAQNGYMGSTQFGNISRFFGLAVFNVLDYGAVADDVLGAGGTDNTTPFQNAINAAQSAGGGIVFVPAGRYSIMSGLTITQNSVWLMGVGCAYTTDVGDYTLAGGSWIVWRGAAANAIMLDCYPSNVGASAIPLLGLRISGINFDGRDLQVGPTDVGANQAGHALRLQATFGWHISDIYIIDCAVAGIELSALPAGTIGGTDSHGTARGILERFCIRQLDGATLPGIGLKLSGTSTANANFNVIQDGQIMYDGSNTGKPAIQFNNSDSNTLINVVCNRGGSSTTNWGVEFLGSNSSLAEVCRANQLFHCSPGANGAIICGTSGGMRPDQVAAAGYNFTYPARDDRWRPQSTENGEPVPYIAAGALSDFGITGGSTGPYFDGLGTAYARLAAIRSIANTETSVVGEVQRLPKYFLRAGTVLRFMLSGLLTNTTAASSSVIRVRIGPTTLTGTEVAKWTVALGTTARTNCPIKIIIEVGIYTQGAAGTALGQVTVAINSTTNLALPTTQLTAAVAINTFVDNFVQATIISGAATSVWNIHSAIAELV